MQICIKISVSINMGGGISKPRDTMISDYFSNFQWNNGVLMEKNRVF